MKNALYLIIIIFLYSVFPLNSFVANADNYYWAKIEKSDTFFYANADETSALFILPQSYFVKLVGEEENFYFAQYKDISGYVKKEGVTPMDGTPIIPYFNETFRTFIPSGTGLYALTEMKEQYKIINIPYLYDNLTFYGSISGEIAIPDKSNLWHYCKYENDQYGYVYSSLCDQLSQPEINNEKFEIVENLSFAPEIEAAPLSSSAMTFIIIGVSLPCLIVLYLLMKPNMMTAKLPRQKEKYKSSKRKDYFEFDQSDLN